MEGARTISIKMQPNLEFFHLSNMKQHKWELFLYTQK